METFSFKATYDDDCSSNFSSHDKHYKAIAKWFTKYGFKKQEETEQHISFGINQENHKKYIWCLYRKETKGLLITRSREKYGLSWVLVNQMKIENEIQLDNLFASLLVAREPFLNFIKII